MASSWCSEQSLLSNAEDPDRLTSGSRRPGLIRYPARDFGRSTVQKRLLARWERTFFCGPVSPRNYPRIPRELMHPGSDEVCFRYEADTVVVTRHSARTSRETVWAIMDRHFSALFGPRRANGRVVAKAVPGSDQNH
jgi:hypothetical protein